MDCISSLQEDVIFGAHPLALISKIIIRHGDNLSFVIITYDIDNGHQVSCVDKSVIVYVCPSKCRLIRLHLPHDNLHQQSTVIINHNTISVDISLDIVAFHDFTEEFPTLSMGIELFPLVAICFFIVNFSTKI